MTNDLLGKGPYVKIDGQATDAGMFEHEFVVNPETLYADISMTKIPVTVKAPTIKLIIDPRQTTRAKEVIKSKIPKTSYSIGGCIS